MKIYAYFCGELDHQFTDTDDKQVEEMCRRLDDPDNDTRSYWLEGGRPILYWRRDGRIQLQERRFLDHTFWNSTACRCKNSCMVSESRE